MPLAPVGRGHRASQADGQEHLLLAKGRIPGQIFYSFRAYAPDECYFGFWCCRCKIIKGKGLKISVSLGSPAEESPRDCLVVVLLNGYRCAHIDTAAVTKPMCFQVHNHFYFLYPYF